jgi:plastocyanin
MTRARLTAAIAICAAAAGAAPGTAQAPAPGTAVGVSEREFTISPYRRQVPPGLVRFNIRNYGEDGHNLVVVSPRGRQLAASPEVEPGGRHTLAVRLRGQGTYRLLCTQADHLRRGMAARLRVRSTRR